MVRVIDQSEQFGCHSFTMPTSDYAANSKLSSLNDQLSNSASSQTFICILSDLTDASNTCKRHVINLSGSYTIEHLIREAADFYSYDPFSFSLYWKSSLNNEMINLTELQETSMSLVDLGLTLKKNTFEIHEKDGPPKRIIKPETFPDDADFYQYKNSISSDMSNDNINMLEPLNYKSLIESSLESGTYPPRRNAISNQIKPISDNSSSMDLTISSTYNNQENTGYVGLINQAMTCYLNSLLQTLYMTPEFRNAIYRWKSNESQNYDDDGKKNIPLQLQRLFLNLQTSNKKSVQTHDLTKSFGWNSEDAFQQHDVQELSRVMFDALEKMFKGTEQQNLINELYQGKIKDYVKCLECDTESARVDVYLDVPLCIRPFGSNKTFESVEEALDAFVQPEILDENNKYFCSKCNRMCKAHKGLKFDSFPYILSLQLKRFDFDYNTLSRFKLNNSVSFPETLNVKKYLEKENPSETVNNELDSKLEDLANNEKVKIEESSLKNDPYDYELYSIMIHSGSATGGHYYAYIKCFEKDQWYNFNDEKVTTLERHEISKAFGTSYSMYSSATAYMLLYRQKNSKRNEKFIKSDEFSEHIKDSLEKSKKQQAEADILKEYMENVCKVKVIVSEDEFIGPASKPDNELNPIRRKEKIINIHKDLTLDKAKIEILKDFNLENYMETNNKKCRLLKYDTYNDLIELSYKTECDITVFEAVGFTKFPYNFCWYLELIPKDEEFIEYQSNEYKIKVISLNLNTLETHELFYVRLKDDARVSCLRDKIAEQIADTPPESVRMALEKTNSIYNYVYLNDNMDDLLKSLNFTRVCKVYIETEEKPTNNIKFPESRFFYALDAIANMIQMTVFLPNTEQCEFFELKTKRRRDYIELQNQLFKKSKILKQQSKANPEENLILTAQKTSVNEIPESSIPMINEVEEINTYLSENSTINFDNDTSSKMSVQLNVENFDKRSIEPRKLDQTNYDELESNLTPNHLKSIDANIKNEMETSMEDEGIGSSTKSSNSLETFKVSCTMINEDFLATQKKNMDIQNAFSTYSQDPDNIKNSSNSVDNENFEDEDDNETHLGDVAERCDVDLEELDADWTDVDNNTNINIEEDYNSHDPSELSEINPNSLFDFDNKFSSLYTDSSDLIKQRVKFCDSSFAEKPFGKDLKSYGDLKVPESLNIFSHDSDQHFDENKTNQNKENSAEKLYKNRFIRSNLSVNEDLGTRILEIRMDKRIELNEFKSHANEYLKISNDNFRVFRICQNDIECELTSHENQFSYLTQNTKFLVKLGPPLKYGEYVLPVFKVNKVMGSISYLCDFMIVHGLSVLNHKELLREDLKEECNLDVEVEKLRLRKKISKRPGNILLNSQVFGKDIFVNPTSELCIEILDEPEQKSNSKLQTSVYLRHWKSENYELEDLFEVIVDGNTFEALMNYISLRTGLGVDEIEVLKCKRDYPFKSPILEIHNDPNWKTNFYLQMEKLEDGVCFYYRNKNLDLGILSEEKRRDMMKTDNINFRPIITFTSRKETGVKIQVENN